MSFLSFPSLFAEVDPAPPAVGPDVGCGERIGVWFPARVLWGVVVRVDGAYAWLKLDFVSGPPRCFLIRRLVREGKR